MSEAAVERSARYWLGTAGAVILGAVLLLAAWAKAIDPAAFAEQITAEGLDGWASAGAIALVAVALEVGLGIALLLNARRLWVLIPAGLLVAFFLFLTGRAYVADLMGLEASTASCGCFGNLVQRSPAQAFWQDAVLLVPGLVLAFMGRGVAKDLPWRRLAGVAAGVAAALWLTLNAAELPLDDLATRLKPGAETNEMCVGQPEDPEFVCLDALVPELDSGVHWVVLTHLDEDDLLARLDGLHAHSLADGEPHLWFVSDVLPEDLNAFSWQHMVATDIRLVPPALMRPLYRRLPRSFRVEDGTVVETLDGIPALGGVEEGVASLDRGPGRSAPEVESVAAGC